MKKLFHISLKIFLPFCLVLFLLVLLLRFSLPYFFQPPANWNAWLSEHLQLPVQVEQASLNWRGFNPRFEFKNLTLSDEAGHEIQIHQAELVIGFWRSLLHLTIEPKYVSVSGSRIVVARQNTQWSVNGIILNNNSSPESGINWKRFLVNLLNYAHVNINQLDLTYVENGQTIQFNQIDLSLTKNILKQQFLQLNTAILFSNQPPIPFDLQASLKISPDLISSTINGAINLNQLQLPEFILTKLKYGNYQISQAAIKKLSVNFIWRQHYFELTRANWLNLNLALTRSDNKQLRLVSNSGALNMTSAGLEGQQLQLAVNNQALQPFDIFLMKKNNDNLLQINQIAINQLLPFLEFFVPESEKLNISQLNGVLQQFYLSWKSNFKNITAYSDFHNLVFQNKNTLIKNLSGEIHYTSDQITLNLNGKNLQLHPTQAYKAPLIISHYAIDAKLSPVQGQWFLTVDNAVMKFLQGNLDFSAKIPFSAPYQVNVSGNFAFTNLAYLKQYLPYLIMSPRLSQWLQSALISSQGIKGKFLLAGDLSQFPFDQGEGQFKVNTIIDDAVLNFKTGWPIISHLNAEVDFIGRSMNILAKSGVTDNIPFQNVTATMADLSKSSLEINAKFLTTLEKGQHYVNNSPLKNNVGRDLKNFQLSGNLPLDLSISIPLHDDDIKTQVKGLIAFDQARVDMPRWNLSLNNFTGDVSFTENVIAAPALNANLWQKPVALAIDTDKTGTVQVKMSGKITADDLENYLNHLPLLTFFSGETDYSGLLSINQENNKQTVTLKLASDLNGMKVDLPQPLTKSTDEKMPFEFTLKQNSDSAFDIDLKYSDLLTGRLGLAEVQGDWKTIAAGIYLGNKPAVLPANNQVKISGNLQNFNWEEFKPFLDRYQTLQQKQTTGLKPVVDLQIGTLTAAGFNLNNIRVGLSAVKNAWLVKLATKDFSGNIVWPNDFNYQACLPVINSTRSLPLRAQGFDRLNDSERACLKQHAISINLDFLRLSSNLEKNLKPDRAIKIPALLFSARDFQYNNKKLGAVSFDLLPLADRYLINNIMLNDGATTLRAYMNWYRKTKDQSEFIGQLNTNNLGKTLSNWAVSNNLAEGSGQANFQFAWQGTPYEPDLNTLSGKLNFDFSKGRIINLSESAEADVGIGRVLNLLSLQTLTRRLSLDFSDLTKSGYSFDHLRADFNLRQGAAYTENAELNGSIAKITFKGQIGLNNQTYNLFLNVTPYVTGSVPVVAAVAGGPIVGAVTWVASKILSPAVNQITTQHYRVTGAWDKPVFQKATNNTR